MSLLMASTALLGLSLTQGPHAWSDGMNLKGAELVDALSIVRPIKKSATSTREVDTLGRKGSGDVSVTEVEVLASTSLRAGANVRLVSQIFRHAPEAAPAYVLGKNYLAIAMRPQEGRLPVPEASLGFAADPRGVPLAGKMATSFIASEGPDELSALAVFPTAARALTAGPPASRILHALIDALTDARGEDMLRLTRFLSTTVPPQMQSAAPFASFEDNEFTRRIRANGTGLPPVERTRALGVLIAWRVRNSEQPFLDALIEASKVENAFGDEELFYDLHFVPIGTRHAPPNYKPARLDANRWADSVLDANSVPARHYLLKHFGGKPDDARRAKLEAALAGMDPESQRLLRRTLGKL